MLYVLSIKTHPPVILYHGSRTERTPEKLARGFYNPQTNSKSHFELNVGAISFTKDPNLNYYIEKFGGKEAKNISQVEIPYAEYEFRRVNMPLTAYDNQDLNYLARAITGSPDVARPLSLPRSQTFKETEDAFVEADKLKVTQDVADISEKFGKISARETKINDALIRLACLSCCIQSMASIKHRWKRLVKTNTMHWLQALSSSPLLMKLTLDLMMTVPLVLVLFDD